ncbi:Gfo/Idh/MocA family oxidoreductase [Blastopirellula sp. J2-11]|uniref:Gfo/Idh/MocA family protein n=1 Tax=Blastopirellula sp. J2-11 TaxID=2943192 RepID=UPI0021CA52B9|nr:Gfo/Idh/MocA family oxidoreductase [Blastopirellula sp. J2-11]UUO04520.1 Gfo/Idh/MocA family oxidoreductase [Blastopirellula sp. J2-11]
MTCIKNSIAGQVGVGLLGSRFISSIHVEALRSVKDAEILAVASATEENVRSFAAKHKIAHWFTDYQKLLEMPEIDMVVIGLPNHLHCEAVLAAAAAGKDIVLEKPMAPSLAECNRMIAACNKAGVKLMYAEELCFAPKYVRLKQLVDEGAIGVPYLLKQSEKHDGPHSEWFWDMERSGGGVTLDLGCHAFEFFRWLLSGPDCLNRPRAVSVLAQMGTYVHGDKTRGDDDAIIIVEFENGCRGLAEESWAKLGGMDDRAEVYGSKGLAYANLLQGNSIQTYSQNGYEYAVEKSGGTKGWSFTIYEELWNYGFPQEMAHFVDCVKHDNQPIVTGEDGLAVMEIVMAAYASAGEGRRIDLPLHVDAKRPIDLWLK